LDWALHRRIEMTMSHARSDPEREMALHLHQ